MAPVSPTIARWELMLRIGSRAEERGEKAHTLARAIDVSPQYWSKLVKGRGVLTEQKLSALVKLLEFDPDEQDELLALREDAKGSLPFAEFSALFTDPLLRYCGLESGASAMRSFENAVVSGLLQTEDYMRALMKSSGTTYRPTEAEQRLRARLHRQRRLEGPNAMRLSVVMGQASLMYQVGSPAIQRDQLHHLSVLADRHPDTLSIRVIPFEAGTSLASLNASTFHLLSFDSPWLPVLGWMENGPLGEIVEDGRRVDALEYLFEQEERIALSQGESLELIDKIARKIG
ncbi:helix-turn-helix domain-containing protein [Nocardia sp. NPDC059764]|uniref:helix-turn-helix domain-containing protein n=1 Tax=Nocardia sp. NPDC059764 TaxID=3346939 RepID=UPI003665F219